MTELLRSSHNSTEVAIKLNGTYEQTLGLRIALQKTLDVGNKLPVTGSLIQELKCNEDILSAYSSAHAMVTKTLDNIHALLSKQVTQNDDTNDSNSIISKKRSRLPSWEEIHCTQKKLRVKWVGTINKWHARLNFGSEQKKSSMKVFNQTIWDQINLAICDENRLLEKSRIQWSESSRIDKIKSNSENDLSFDEEVYDDKTFYSMLLKTFISSSRQDHQLRADDLAALRQHKKKTNVDRKASKGRKIRYVVHPKLQNFMFPIPILTENVDTDRMIESLFHK